MIILVILIIALSLYGAHIFWTKGAPPPLCREQTTAINGIFVLMVFVDHFVQRAVRCGYGMEGLGDGCYTVFRSMLLQLHVVSFLSFSGYGIMESIKKKGDAYIDGIPRLRFLPVWANFAIGVLVIALLNCILGIQFPVQKFFTALIGWHGIGNPSWFIFCILWCYASVYISFRLLRLHWFSARLHIARLAGVFGVVFFCMVYILLHLKLRPERTWNYNTILAFPFGLILSLTKDRWRMVAQRYWSVLFVMMVFVFCYLNENYRFRWNGLGENICGCVFILVIILLSMKIKIGNMWLSWLGRHVFSIYMYQFVFFILLEKYTAPSMTSQCAVFVSFAGCLGLTLLTAHLSRFWMVDPHRRTHEQ